MRRYKDLTGKKYGRLTVISFAGLYITPSGQKHAKWNCICDCGNEIVARASSLSVGDIVSCGCYNKERSTKHGMSRTRLYQIWSGMKNRCTNKNSKPYIWYGQKGISVSDEWQEYEPFHQWAIENGYNDTMTIDRIDPDKSYCPENCRWLSISENVKRASEIIVEIDGVALNMSEWSRKIGMSRNWFYRVKTKYGLERAIEMLKEKLMVAI